MQIEKNPVHQQSSTSHQTLSFGGIEFQRPSNKNTRPWEQTKYSWIDNKPKNGQGKDHE